MFRKLIGSKAFYKYVLALTLPIMLQNAITNFVSMLDNIMIGRIGTAEMSGVSIANLIIFVFNLCIFGAVSGAGIFGTQFYGNKDTKGLQYTFRFKIIGCTVISAIGILILVFFGEDLLMLYLHQSDGGTTDIAATLGFAKDYLYIMLAGMIPYTLAQCYSSTLRETGQTVVPMIAGISAVFVNLSLNYILIYGKLGAPKLGVTGAAVATVISRFAELAVAAIWTHRHKNKNQFIKGAYKSLYVPLQLAKQIISKGLPLMINETLWAAGVAALNQCYSTRGLAVVAANQICSTFYNVFSTAFISIGAAISIILGQMLGAGETDKARDTAGKLIAFSVAVSIIISGIYGASAQFIPLIYNTNENVRNIAANLMRISSVIMPLEALMNALYFTLRSGGKILITILFDSCFMWSVQVSTALILSQFTDIPILHMFAICQSLCFIKCIIGFILVKKGSWVRNIVADQN